MGEYNVVGGLLVAFVTIVGIFWLGYLGKRKKHEIREISLLPEATPIKEDFYVNLRKMGEAERDKQTRVTALQCASSAVAGNHNNVHSGAVIEMAQSFERYLKEGY